MMNQVDSFALRRRIVLLAVASLLLATLACKLFAPAQETPTPVSQACVQEPDPLITVVQANWREVFNCPAATSQTAELVWIPFERGHMLLERSTRQIHVLVAGDDFAAGALTTFSDAWQPGDPVEDPAITPPEGLYQPDRGFGVVWRENPELRQQLGWATTPATAYPGVQQAFAETGAFVLTMGNGDLVALFAASGRWGRLPVSGGSDYYGGAPAAPGSGVAALGAMGALVVIGLVFSGRRRTA